MIGGVICYPEKDVSEIKKLFDSRYNLYKDCYNHRVTQSFECLLLDILNSATGLCDWLTAIRNPDLYLALDDTILHRIRLSEEPELEEARNLLARFDSRRHYSFVGEKVVNKELKVTESDVCKFGLLQPSDIVVRLYSVNMGMKDKNPLANVSFYKMENNKATLVTKELREISSMMPERVQSTTLRCFVK